MIETIFDHFFLKQRLISSDEMISHLARGLSVVNYTLSLYSSQFQTNFGKSFFYDFSTMNNSSIFTNDTYKVGAEDEHTDDGCPRPGEKNVLENAPRITAFTVILATSLIGNVFIIVITRLTQRMRKMTVYNFVVNMAIADLCTTVINMPESLVVEMRDTDEWLPGVVGVALCKLLPFCQQVCTFCSILSLLTIAIDMFFAICLPLRGILTRKRSKIIIAASWLIPCIVSTPMFVANNVIKTEGLILCLEEWPSALNSMNASRDYTIILFVLFYLLPLIIISLSYGCVIYTLWKRKRPGNFSSQSDTIFSRRKRKALKMFIAIVICFAICWLPDHVLFFIMAYDDEFYNCGFTKNAYFISLFFTHAISAFNPCIYIVFNKEYRYGFKRMINTCFNL